MNFTIQTAQVASNFCHSNWPATWQYLVSLLSVSSADFTGVNKGNTPPSAEARDKPWYRYNSDGTPDGWYVFANGHWLKPYSGPGAGVIMMWDGAEPDIVTLDGGEAGTISATTGAFWEKVSAMDARFPLGVGTYGTTNVAVGAIGGAHEVELDLENIPAHDHGIAGKKVVHQVTPSGVLQQTSGNDLTTSTFRADGGKANGTTKPHANMPPYRGIFFIKRTARLYHRA